MASSGAGGLLGPKADPPPSLMGFDDALPMEPNAATAPPPAKVRTGKEAQVDEILNSILPPRMWEQTDGSAWVQYVSKAPAERVDVDTLEAALEQRLMERQAREGGICSVREDLFRQAFDELIRQVTLNSPERGLLLMRVRDERRMALDAYKALFESSIVFGVRKQLQSEEGMDRMSLTVRELEEDKRRLEARVLRLRHQKDAMDKRRRERRALDASARKEEVDLLRHENQQLEQFLRSLPGGNK